MRISYRKLVRDRIPEIVAREGKYAKTRRLGAGEFKKELLKKLLEEAKEAHDARGKDELAKELGDVIEVLSGIYTAFGLLPKQVEKIRRERNKARGGFKKRLFLEYVE